MHPDLQQLIARLQTTEAINLSAVRAEIAEIWPRLQTEPDRLALLELREHFMDFVERSLSHDAERLAQVRKARAAEYQLFLTKEAMLDGSNVDPAELDRVTAREVAAGRLAPDSEYRAFASAAGKVLAPPKRGPGLFKRIFG